MADSKRRVDEKEAYAMECGRGLLQTATSARKTVRTWDVAGDPRPKKGDDALWPGQ